MIHKLTFLSALFTICLSFTSCLIDDGLVCIKEKGEIVEYEFEVDDFERVVLLMDAEVEVVKGEGYQVMAYATDNILDILDVDVRNTGTLELDTRRGTCIRGQHHVRFVVTCPSLESMDLAGSGSMVMGQGFSGTSLELTLSGSGELGVEGSSFTLMDLRLSGSGQLWADQVATNEINGVISGSGSLDLADIQANLIDLDLTGSGQIFTEGDSTVGRLDLDLIGSGDFFGFDMGVTDVDVHIGGSGTARVYAIGSLDVDISGSGDVWYIGEPSVNTKITGSGNIRKG
jgi:hypothetical protein